jgi:4'-phosphopantetheinyl transferase EntD
VSDDHDAALGAALAGIAMPGILIGHRLIAPDDAAALYAEEAASIPTQVPVARRASGAVRIVGRQLLAQMGIGPCPLPKGPSGAPVWPAGVVGSFAHADRVAVAALAKRTAIEALGIDIEPAGPLPAELLDVVATARERLMLGRDAAAGRLLFAAKEAVYKAVNPRDGRFLEYHDIDVDLAAGSARVRNGDTLMLRTATGGAHAMALAVIAA